MVLGLADIATSLGGRIARGDTSALRGISSLAVMGDMLGGHLGTIAMAQVSTHEREHATERSNKRHQYCPRHGSVSLPLLCVRSDACLGVC